MDQKFIDAIAKYGADKMIDASEAEEIRKEVYADGKISREEADFAFALNDATTDSGKNSPEWDELFSDIISDHVCEDGEITSEESDYLKAKLMGDGGVDMAEMKVLKKIRIKATKIDPVFDAEMKALGA